ncbi:MAG: PQQ-binding-like beta-propeller repeat protein [Kiritimatiellaeota bacterium]|nr:PQQ-binding-like beta-propeller repeat protein [Kiritimatiellota bacterium]
MKNEKLELAKKCLRAVAWMAAWFLATLAVMMALQWAQAREALPGAEAALAQLKAALPERQGEAGVAEQIRQLDYLYRNAYFHDAYRWRVGMRLGMAALCVIVLACAGLLALGRHAPRPPERTRRVAGSLRFFVGGAAGAIVAVMCGVGGYALWEHRTSNIEHRTSNESTPPLTTDHWPLTTAEGLWRQFRGGEGSCETLEAGELAEAWRVRVPLSGYGSPVVAGGQVVVTGGNRSQRAVLAFSADDGAALWRYDLPAVAALPEVTEDTGYAASTPATDGNLFFAIFATGQLVAVDRSGKLAWKRDFPAPDISYGYASSLALFDGKLIVQFDTADTHALYALDPADGSEAWRNERPDDSGSSWATPLGFEDADGRKYVVTLTNERVACFDAASGETVWSRKDLYGEIAASPTFAAGHILVMAAGLPATAYHPATGEIVWKNFNVALPDVSSAAILGDYAYFFNANGNVGALSVTDGQEAYEDDFPGGFYASPVAFANGLLLIGGMDGTLYLFEQDGAGLQVRQRLALGAPIFATAAVTQDGIFVRASDDLIKITP